MFLGRFETNELGCWLWPKGTDAEGYGTVWYDKKNRKVHVVMYTVFVGPVPAGKELDHVVCQIRRCANPTHLEPVTHAENVRRGYWASKTHCKNGHEFTPENTYRYRGVRLCKKCRAGWAASWYKAKRRQNGGS